MFAAHSGPGPNKLIISNADFKTARVERLAETGDTTLIFYDLRNGGQSHVIDRAKLERGVEHNIEDLDAIRAHFGSDRVAAMQKLRYLARWRRRRRIPQMFSDYIADLRHFGA